MIEKLRVLSSLKLLLVIVIGFICLNYLNLWIFKDFKPLNARNLEFRPNLRFEQLSKENRPYLYDKALVKSSDSENSWKNKNGYTIRSFRECNKIEAGIPSKNYENVLKKNIFSNQAKFVFVVGLEGTGHHLFQKIYKSCKNCNFFSEWMTVESEFTIPQLRNFLNWRHGFFGSQNTLKNFEKIKLSFKNYFPEIQKKYFNDASLGNRTVALNCCCEPNPGMYSYPNGWGDCLQLQYPDVRLLADLFEESGLDLRIVVLVRNPLDILISTTVLRGMGEWERQVVNYERMLRLGILTQLNRLDSKFFKCLDFDDLPDVSKDLGEFIGITNFEEIVKNVHQVKQMHEKERQRESHAEMMETPEFKAFEKSINMLKDFCR